MKLVAARRCVHSIKYAVVLLVKHVLTLLNKSVATTSHAQREGAVVTVLVQIYLGSCVVGCQSVLGIHAVGKVLQQGAVRMARCAVGMPILLFVVKLENGVRVGSVQQAVFCESNWWCNLHEKDRDMAMLHDFQFSSIISTFCIFVLRPSTFWFVACQITIENYCKILHL